MALSIISQPTLTNLFNAWCELHHDKRNAVCVAKGPLRTLQSHSANWRGKRQMFSSESIPFWTAVAAISASATVLFSCIFSVLTVKLMRQQVEPKMIVFLRHSSERANLIYIVIKNIGADEAQRITFKSSRPIPEHAFGMPGTARKPTVAMSKGPLVSGIPALGPGEEREILWGQYGGISLALEDGPIDIQFRYRGGRRSFEGRAELEVASFLGTDATEASAAKAVRHLDQIHKSIERFIRATETETRRRRRQAEVLPWKRRKSNSPT